MKRTLIFYFLVLLSFAESSLSDDFYIKIYYLNGEKSKDSYSVSEDIFVRGMTAEYSVKYSGRISSEKSDTGKSCTVTGEAIDSIKSIIVNRRLTVIDSLYGESSKTKSIQRYCSINIECRFSGHIFKIKINGDLEELREKELYENSVYLISFIRDLIEKC